MASEPAAPAPVRTAAVTLSASGCVSTPEPFLALLAKAVQRQRNYAPNNPLCAKAAAQCQQALLELADDPLVLRVTPRALLLPDNTPAGEAHVVQTELTRRLHRAAVGTLTISRAASQWEITRFCRALVEQAHRDLALDPLGDVLQRLGVEHLHVTTLPQPAVLEVGAPDDLKLACVRDQQQWREADIAVRGPGGHLYAPNKGWVRVDPACPLRTVSLGDLALLADDPRRLAGMLVRLSDDQADVPPEEAFERQLEQIAHLIRSLSPPLVEPMFSRLADSLLTLDAERRRHLLSTILLPGLLDGRFDGTLLRQLPDAELAGALDALGDVQVAAPAMVIFALDRLGLDGERRRRIESALLTEPGEPVESEDPGAPTPGRIGGYTDGRIHVDHDKEKSFNDFAGVDIAMTADVAAAIEALRRQAAATSPDAEQARCVLNLLGLESNPSIAAGLVSRASAFGRTYHQAAAWDVFADWIGRCRGLADAIADDRSEVAAQISTMVGSYATPELVETLVDLAVDERGRETAARVLEGLGGAAVAPAFEVLKRETSRGRRRTLLGIMSVRPRALADALAGQLKRPEWFIVRNALYLLGHAGGGHEAAVAACIRHADERVAREAFRALAQIGTTEAVAYVGDALACERRIGRLAFDALSRFQPAVARTAIRAFLASPDQARRRPGLACRLLDRVGAGDAGDLGPVLRQLTPLRWRFWRPAVMRLGFKAAARARRA